MKPTILLLGDEQAEALSVVMNSMSIVTERAQVVYGTNANSELAKLGVDLPHGSVVCLQDETQSLGRVPTGVRSIQFPRLDFYLFWPFNCVNPYNLPEPPLFPFGRFPYGDRFVLQCIERQMRSEQILGLYHALERGDEWPDLNELFQKESVRLAAKDSDCDVKIGSYILKHFRKERLFVAAHAPTDVLLAELTRRLLAAIFGSDLVMKKPEIVGVIAGFGARDFLGALAVPIHENVAEHFDLLWYDPNATHNFFDIDTFSHDEYINEMIASIEDAKHSKVPS